MTFYENLSKLCEINGISISGLLSELNMSASNKQKWQNGATVNSTVLSKIADYFQVSTDYLLGRTETQQNLYQINTDNVGNNSNVNTNNSLQQFNSDDVELLNLIRELSLVDKAKIIVMINEMKGNKQNGNF